MTLINANLDPNNINIGLLENASSQANFTTDFYNRNKNSVYDSLQSYLLHCRIYSTQLELMKMLFGFISVDIMLQSFSQ